MNSKNIYKGVRKILHIDMDCFYAAVEVLDNPKLKGKPVIVGGDPNSRGVVATASYEARKFGVHSAMSCSQAQRLCPNGIFVRGKFSRYKEISAQIHAIFRRYTHLVQPLSLDEAWLDVTENFQNIPSATVIAQQIQKAVLEEVGLTCSVGVSYNKFLAKIASDEHKPFGICVITPEKAQTFIDQMPLKKIPGVGKVTQKKMKSLGLEKGSDLRDKPKSFLTEHFGKMGNSLYDKVRGVHESPVVVERERKSVSAEHTFAEDYEFGEELLGHLEKVVEDLDGRLKKNEFEGRTLTLKVKFADFDQVTRSVSQSDILSSKSRILEMAKEKLQMVCHQDHRKIRLLGVGVSQASSPKEEKTEQLTLFG